MRFVAAYFFTLVVFLGIDFIWLSRVARGLYAESLGDLLLEKPNMVAAGIFYLFYVVGIVVFAVAPALRSGEVMTAVLYGALFGLLAYGTYDMTNYATLKNWPVLITFVDIAWGGILTGFSAGVGYLLTRALVS